jgi:hypothetical protein
LLASLLWLAYRLLLKFLGVAGVPTIYGLLTVSGNQLLASLPLLKDMSMLFPVSHMVMVLFQKETSLSKLKRFFQCQISKFFFVTVPGTTGNGRMNT